MRIRIGTSTPEEAVFIGNSAAALILNSGYEPLKVVSWKKAIILWLQDKVEVIEYHKTTVSTPSKTFYLPSVVRLKTYMKPYFTKSVRLSRQNIFLRDQQTCQYCLQKLTEKKFTIDHVVPLSKGGKHEWTNVVAACSKCNNKKGSKTPEQVNMKLFKKPVEPRWLPSHELEVLPEKIPVHWRPYLATGSD